MLQTTNFILLWEAESLHYQAGSPSKAESNRHNAHNCPSKNTSSGLASEKNIYYIIFLEFL